jgi:ABC-2 type transport system permease protein
MTVLARPAVRHRGGPLTGTRALTRLAQRRDRAMLVAWIYVLTASLAGTAYSFKGLYKTEASRQQVAAGAAHNPALIALTGPVFGTSVGALSAWKIGAFAAIAAALMNIFLVVRHTRADEESGRLELVGSTAVGRHAPLAVGLLVAVSADCALAVVPAAAMIAVGMPAGGAFALGLAIASCGLVFAAVAALTAQLSGTARGARGSAIAVLGIAYLLQSAGTAAGADGPRWLAWLSPVGWAVHVQAFAGDRWLVLLLPLGLAVAVAGAAAAVAARRDLGAGLLPSRPGPATAPVSLRSPLALAWRLQRGSLAGWVAGAVVYGVVAGATAEGIQSLLGSGPAVKQALARIGGQSGMTDAYLVVSVSLIGIAAGCYAVSAVLRLRAEESAQRAEPILVTATSRVRWAGSHLVVALVGTAVMLAAGGLAAGLGYGLRAGDPGPQVPRLLGAAMAQLPAALAVAAAAVLLFGFLPRWSTGGAWSVVALVVLVDLLGETLRLSHWIVDLSPFTQVPRLPGGVVTAAPLLWLSAAAVALTAAGLAGLRHRDIG